MIPSAILLLLMVALIAKMIYDVQKFKPLKREKLERARLQFNAGLEVEEYLVEELRIQGKLNAEKLKKQAQKTAKDESKEVLPVNQTAVEMVLAQLGELERIEQRKANKDKV